MLPAGVNVSARKLIFLPQRLVRVMPTMWPVAARLCFVRQALKVRPSQGPQKLIISQQQVREVAWPQNGTRPDAPVVHLLRGLSQSTKVRLIAGKYVKHPPGTVGDKNRGGIKPSQR